MKSKLKQFFSVHTLTQIKSSTVLFWDKNGFAVVLLFCAAIIGFTAVLTRQSSTLPGPAPAPTTMPTLRALTTPAYPAVDAGATTPVPTTNPYLLPVTGTQGHGYQMQSMVFYPAMQEWAVHDGVDFHAPQGTPVVAIADGTVEEAYEDVLLGNVVTLRHEDGLLSGYASLTALDTVSVGQSVSAGKTIGHVGQSAALEADLDAHLHFFMRRDGESVNPFDILPLSK